MVVRREHETLEIDLPRKCNQTEFRISPHCTYEREKKGTREFTMR